MATTWNSLNFGIQTGDSVPLAERELLQSIRRIPYSDAAVLDIGGLGEWHFRATIRITPGSLALWRSTLGDQADLVVDDVTYADAVLLALTNIRRTPRSDWVLADAEWVY